MRKTVLTFFTALVTAVSVQAQTIAEIVANSPDHNTLEAALDAAELTAALSGTDQLTLFAPTDAAFNALPTNLVNALLTDPSGVLSDILLYHVVAGDNPSGSLSDGQEIPTLFGDQEVTVTINGGMVMINNAVVTVANLDASNGVVHVIDAVLIPATTTVYDVVVDSPDHTTLEAAINAAELDGTLSGEGAFTLFAPTDAAFDALPQGVVETLLADPTGNLADVLLYHAVGSIALSTDLSDDQMIETINGQDVTVTIENGNVFINQAQVTVANIVTVNGVVHVIDAVLVPSGAICTTFEEGPFTNFNTLFGGAPVAENGVCPVNQITTFEVWASERYTVDNFEAGREYTFSICEGPGAGSWNPELTVFGPGGGLIAIAQDCEITWTAPVAGTYQIGIQEVGFCGAESPNLEEDNGFPTLTCTSANTVLTIISESEVHNTLEAAINAADLGAALSGDDNVTVFAPTDDAFAALPASLIEALLSDPTGVLTDILLYHVVDGAALSSSLSDGQMITTLNGQDVTIGVDGATITVNNAVVTIADLEADNGVVHVIDAVLLPEATTVYDVVVNSDDHTTLETAINLAGLDGTLDGPGTFTLFAPTDAAFAAVPTDVLDALLADPTGNLTDVLLYHVLDDIALSTNLVDGMVPTVFGETVTIDVDGATVSVNNAEVTVADIVTINGVVHVIDAVLIPSTLSAEEIAELNRLNIFPNPANAQLTVNLDLAQSQRIAIDFVSITGQVVKSLDLGMRSTGQNIEVIDVQDLAKGIYLMNITVGQNQITSKVQITR